MDVDAVGRLVSNVGFPVVVAGFVLYRIDPLMRSLLDAVNSLKGSLDVVAATMNRIGKVEHDVANILDAMELRRALEDRRKREAP